MNERQYEPIFVEINKLKNKCGIYQLRNIINNHIYIGSSKNLKERIKSHFKSLKYNKHDNKHLQNAYNKYGKDNFVFEIIEYCEIEERFKIEQYWLDIYFGNKCYNLNPKAVNPPDMTGTKRTFTKEHCKNISISQRKRFQNPDVLLKHSQIRIGKNMGKEHPNSVPVVCLETGVEYECIQEAKRKLNIKGLNISECCLGRYMTSNGFHWLYKKDYEKLTKEEIQEIIYTKNKFKVVVHLETQKIYTNIKKATKETGIKRDGIIDCCEHKIKETKGTHWVYYNEFKNMSNEDVQFKLNEHSSAFKKCLCIENNKIYNKLSDAARELGLNAGTISEVCQGKRKHTHKYHFKYIN